MRENWVLGRVNGNSSYHRIEDGADLLCVSAQNKRDIYLLGTGPQTINHYQDRPVFIPPLETLCRPDENAEIFTTDAFYFPDTNESVPQLVGIIEKLCKDVDTYHPKLLYREEENNWFIGVDYSALNLGKLRFLSVGSFVTRPPCTSFADYLSIPLTEHATYFKKQKKLLKHPSSIINHYERGFWIEYEEVEIANPKDYHKVHMIIQRNDDIKEIPVDLVRALAQPLFRRPIALELANSVIAASRDTHRKQVSLEVMSSYTRCSEQGELFEK